MLITRKSTLTGKVNEMNINVTQEQLTRYENGEGLLQDIFPNVPADEREFIKTGITPTEWNAVFG